MMVAEMHQASLDPIMAVDCAVAQRPEEDSHIRRAGFLPVALMFATALLWSRVVTESLYRGDNVTWYHLLNGQKWEQLYSWQPILFLLMWWVAPTTFNDYMFWSITIMLSILLFALRRMRFSATDQLFMVFFFSWSFYGLHYMLNFQRQFLAIVFLLCAIPGGKQSVVWRILSFASHGFAILLHGFWFLRRLSVLASLLVSLMCLPFLFLLLSHVSVLADASSGYVGYGQSELTYLAIKQLLNIVFVVVLLATGRADSRFRALSAVYILLCLLTLFWGRFAGLFNRIDYYFFPILIVLRLHPDSGPQGRSLARGAIAFYTIITCTLWMKLNLGWIVFDVGGAW